jgi:beta-glucosidase
LAEAVRQGAAKEAWLDDKVRRLLTVFDGVGALDDPAEVEAPTDTAEDRAAARRVASEAIVLLRNERSTLPLDPAHLGRVGLIGPGAGALAVMGGGSARVVTHYSLSLLSCLVQRLGAGTEVTLEPGGQLSTGPGGPGVDADGIARAVALARDVDVAVVVVGTNAYWESEGYDRTSMDLPDGQVELVEQVLDANPSTVVVLNTGAPVTLACADRAPALVQCWFGGQELANALVDVLVGDAEPGGRLPMTLPERVEHTPAFGAFPAESSIVRYGEGRLMGYSWYQARRLPVRFPFGFGLSYTTMRIGPARLSTTVVGPGGRVSVEVDVENTGPRAGSEVVQVYVAPPGGGNLVPGGRLRPIRSLKGFAKVRLGPGEKKTVKMELNERSFAYYDVADKAWPSLFPRLADRAPDSAHALHRTEAGWYVDGGTYFVEVARNCDDICQRLEIDVEGNSRPLPATAAVG